MSVLTLTRGDSRFLDLTAVTPANVPYNLTGVALTFMVKRGHDDLDADALISKTVGSGITLTNAVGGIAEIALDAADTAALRPGGTYVYDLQAVDGTDVTTLDSGTVRVLADVTRATA